MYKTAEFVSIKHQLLFCYFYYTNSIVNFSFDDHNPGIIQPAYIRNVARKMSGLSKEAMVDAAGTPYAEYLLCQQNSFFLAAVLIPEDRLKPGIQEFIPLTMTFFP